MRIIDLSLTIENGVGVLGDVFPPPQVEELASLEEQGWVGHRFVLTSLTGTYLETSAHVFPDGEWLDEVPVERCIRPITVFHLSGIGPQYGIRAVDLEACEQQLKAGDAALIHTGWDVRLGEEDYITNSPFFQEDAMRWLLERGAALIGADIPSYDSPKLPMEMVKLLFATNCLLLAPLINLGQITNTRPLLVALPMKVKGVCGAPCRAIVIQN